MAVEDFFTLTEMKAGISTPDRVEELINLMRIVKDKDVKNIGETSRQWPTVVKTIACTNNKECLDRFLQLGGLCIFNTWLNDIQKSASDIPNGDMEESLDALLQALEKLPLDNEKLTSSGVGITLESLVVHSSSVIKKRVHALLDSCKLSMDTSKADADAKEDLSVDDCTNVCIKSYGSSAVETLHLDANSESKSTSTGHNSDTSDSLPTENVKDVRNPECGNDAGTADALDHEAVKDGNSVTPLSTDLCIVKENVSITGSIRVDVDTGFTNTRKESSPNSKKEEEGGSLIQKESSPNAKREEEGGSLEQNVEVLADVGNGITTTSLKHPGDYKEPLKSYLPETEDSSLRSDDSKADKATTKGAQKDPTMVASEGMEMDIPETVCSSSQEKILDGLTEQLFKPSPQIASTGKEFSSDSLTAKAEDDLDGIEPSHANEIVQEAEIKTRAALGFDLNEEVISEDLDPLAVSNQELNCDTVDHQTINQTSMSTSVISASRPAAVSGLPAGRLQFEGTHGWKGSAATSAFRPASPCKPLESDNVTSSTGPSSNNLKQSQHIHDFDLNMADDENADNSAPDSVIAVSSSHPSEESCVEIGPTKLKRAELDLNSLGDAPPSAYWSVNGLPFCQQNAYKSPSPASSSSSVHPSMWDLDLNKKFSMPNFPCDPPPYMGNPTINFVEGHGARKPASSEISILGARADVGRDEPLPQSQLHPNGNISGFRSFLPPPTMNPSQPLQPFMYRPGIPITMFDPRGSAILPHMIGPAQPPYLMNMMAAPPQAPIGITPPSYSSFDQNMLYMNDAASRNEPHTRQYLMSTHGGFLEPHSSPIPQPSSFLTKRKEPHSGWDPYYHGFSSHHESPGKS